MVGAGTDKTKLLLRGGGPAVILVRPQLAVNIGMCARAMANFGLDDLRLVNPREGWPRSDHYREVAYSAAAGATEAARRRAGLSARGGRRRRPPLRLCVDSARTRTDEGSADPQRSDAPAAAAEGERRGVLFGPERTGLDNDEVAIADSIITFPSSPAYASLNLSQAVLHLRLRVVRGGARRCAASFDDPARNIPARATRDAARFLRVSRSETR